MSVHDSERGARAVLAAISNAGKRDLSGFVARFGAVAAIEHLRSRAGSASWHRTALKRLNGANPWDWAEAILERTDRVGARIAIPTDSQWPMSLNDLSALSDTTDVDLAPPLCLWIRGPLELGAITRRAISLVGARASTPYGVHAARQLGYDVARRDWTVVSGAAYGIDAAAHRGALAAMGPTIAVLGCGVDVPYPAGNTNLLEELAECCLVMSEWPPGTRPARHHFLVRNRVIAALGAGTVVVEAARRSGSRATARYAVDLGRALMAVPGPITSALSEGAHELIREWRGELVTTAQHVIELVGPYGDLEVPKPVEETQESGYVG
ncbi:MAG: DNA-protecting protein DprA [Corynebacteriales bacterium]|nr:DNA-protecting protein DprA [Mycobacteriales bacterium]